MVEMNNELKTAAEKHKTTEMKMKRAESFRFSPKSKLMKSSRISFLNYKLVTKLSVVTPSERNDI